MIVCLGLRKRSFVQILTKSVHRFTYPKDRYFLQPMRTPNSSAIAHAYSPILLLATHAYIQFDLYAYMLEQITKEFEGSSSNINVINNYHMYDRNAFTRG